MLDAAFCRAGRLPIFPTSWDEGHAGYRVEAPGGPEPCAIFVRFRHGAAIEVSLRRYDAG